MSVTTRGVYLVAGGDEIFLGKVSEVLHGSSRYGQGISLHALLTDIVQDIVSDPIEHSRTITIKIRE